MNEITQKDYMEHELAALWAAVERGDRQDMIRTAATLRGELEDFIRVHEISEAWDAAGRISKSNGKYVYPEDFPPEQGGR